MVIFFFEVFCTLKHNFLTFSKFRDISSVFFLKCIDEKHAQRDNKKKAKNNWFFLGFLLFFSQSPIQHFLYIQFRKNTLEIYFSFPICGICDILERMLQLCNFLIFPNTSMFFQVTQTYNKQANQILICLIWLNFISQTLLMGFGMQSCVYKHANSKKIWIPVTNLCTIAVCRVLVLF